MTPYALPTDQRQVDHIQVLKLHGLVVRTIFAHYLNPQRQLPNKAGAFDWGLGESVRVLRGDQEAARRSSPVSRWYGGRLQPQELRPATFGGAPAFRFDLSYVTADGIQRRALVVGAVLEEKLQVIVYDGAALRYFPRYRDQVEHLVESIQLR